VRSTSPRETTTFRPRSARLTAVVIVVIALGAATAHTLAEGPRAATPTLGLATLACVVAIGAYWLPRVTISDTTIEVANVLTTVTVPLARIVHVDTRWAMELELENGRKISAFAAPAPGTSKARNFRLEDIRGLPEDTYSVGAVRVGDSPGTASGDAAILVRTALGEWRASGAKDDRSVTRRANVGTALSFATGVVAAFLGFLM
jgi:hypothetical protein